MVDDTLELILKSGLHCQMKGVAIFTLPPDCPAPLRERQGQRLEEV